MGKELYKFSFSKLKKVILDESYLKNELIFNLSVDYSIQENLENTPLTQIKVTGELTAKNSDDYTAINILMESYFETDELVEDDDLKEQNNHLNTPVLNEITLLLAQLTGKAVKVPIIMPLVLSENNIKESDE